MQGNQINETENFLESAIFDWSQIIKKLTELKLSCDK